MFTGIIQALGHIDAIDIDKTGCRLDVNIRVLDDQVIKPGDSIAVNGVCLTVVKNAQGSVHFDVSLESLSKTCIDDWRVGDEVNLETALTLQTPLGGHIVTGHVDGIGVMLEREDAGNAIKMVFQVPVGLGRYIAQKGSVCIDGVSLTTNQLLEDRKDGTTFAVMLVPHTLRVTSLKRLQADSRVHIEIDVIARYLDRMQAYEQKNLL
jgi:riboflavin synthase